MYNDIRRGMVKMKIGQATNGGIVLFSYPFLAY